MRKSLLASVLVLALAGILVLFNRFAPRAAAQGPEPTPQVETQGDNSRLLGGVSPDALTGLTVSNPYCYQPDVTRNECVINLNYWQFTQNGTTSPYMAYALLKIDGKIRYRSTTFFENSISYNYAMVPNGFKVACGVPNEGGYGADYGKAYNLFIAPYDYSNVTMGSGSTVVFCPAYVP